MRLIERRIGLLFAIFVLLFAVTLARAAWLQGVRGGELSADAHSQQVENLTVPAERGRILDRRGQELAVSEEAASVFATPYQLKNPGVAARKLSEALEVPVDDVLEAISDQSSGFAYVARQMDLPHAEKARKLDIEGVGTAPDSRRVYPQGELAAHLIGGVGIDGEGLTGLESAADETLRGTDGEVEVTRDGLGDEIGRDTLQGNVPGRDVKLTIDARIQAETEQVLAGIEETYSPKGAAAVVVDPRNGKVLAMASVPEPDLEEIGSASEDELLNRATGFTYEPGSTFKAFTVATALEEDIVTPDTSFDLAPTIEVADRTIEEAHPRGAATLTVSEIIAQSSNVGAVTIGLQVGAERLDRWIRRFGFGEPTGIELGDERGIVPELSDYSGSTIGNLPIGQGLAVTPLQMVQGFTAIANEGVVRPPRLILAEDGERIEAPPERRVIRRRTADQVRDMLKGVLAAGGTAAEVKVPGYELAGKTGTSQKAIDGVYSESAFVASFVGFAPADDPRLLAAIVVDEPEGSYYGGSVAAPAFGEIASFALPYLGADPG